MSKQKNIDLVSGRLGGNPVSPAKGEGKTDYRSARLGITQDGSSEPPPDQPKSSPPPKGQVQSASAAPTTSPSPRQPETPAKFLSSSPSSPSSPSSSSSSSSFDWSKTQPTAGATPTASWLDRLPMERAALVKVGAAVFALLVIIVWAFSGSGDVPQPAQGSPTSVAAPAPVAQPPQAPTEAPMRPRRVRRRRPRPAPARRPAPSSLNASPAQPVGDHSRNGAKEPTVAQILKQFAEQSSTATTDPPERKDEFRSNAIRAATPADAAEQFPVRTQPRTSPPSSTRRKRFIDTPSGFRCGGIASISGRRLANINGRYVGEGSVVNGAKVVSITATRVELEIPDGHFHLAAGFRSSPVSPSPDGQAETGEQPQDSDS